MKLSENSDEIIIRHIPFREWLIGGFLILLFVVFIFGLILVSPGSSRGLTENIISDLFKPQLFLLIVLLFVFLFFEIKMFRAPITTVKISRTTKSIDILRQRFYGNENKRFYFSQINKFKSFKGKLNFSSQYFLSLTLANKKVIKLKIPLGNDKQNTVKFIKQLNKFIKTASATD